MLLLDVVNECTAALNTLLDVKDIEGSGAVMNGYERDTSLDDVCLVCKAAGKKKRGGPGETRK